MAYSVRQSKTISKTSRTPTSNHVSYSKKHHNSKDCHAHKNGSRVSLSKGYTDDWYIHLHGDELKELEAVNAIIRNEEVTDDQVKLVVPILPLSEHV